METVVKNTLGVSEGYLDAVVNHLTWKHKAQLHFWRFMHGVKPMAHDDKFWGLLDKLRACIKDARSKDMEKVNGGAREFFRLALTEDWMEDAVAFLAGYKKLKGKISKALGDLFDFHGDSFGDLVDSFPLGGRKLVERALATNPASGKPKRDGFLDENEVWAGRNEVEPDGEFWQAYVGHEMYVESALQEHAEEYLMSWMRHELMNHEHGEKIESCKID
ncbi:MAG: hypothetical protein ACREGR_01635 [Minisyncoccia bacterium]